MRAPMSSRSACCCTSTRAACIRSRRRRRWRRSRACSRATRARSATRCPDVPAALADVIERCLRKAPAERFASARRAGRRARCASATRPRRRSAHATWWRVHQIVVIVLYIVAAALGVADQGVDRDAGDRRRCSSPLGAGATIGGVLRGHLVFTERMNRAAPGGRAPAGDARADRLLDLLIARRCCSPTASMHRRRRARCRRVLDDRARRSASRCAALVLEPATTDGGVRDDASHAMTR